MWVTKLLYVPTSNKVDDNTIHTSTNFYLPTYNNIHRYKKKEDLSRKGNDQKGIKVPTQAESTRLYSNSAQAFCNILKSASFAHVNTANLSCYNPIFL